MTGDQTGERAAKSCQRQFRGGLEPLHDTERVRVLVPARLAVTVTGAGTQPSAHSHASNPAATEPAGHTPTRTTSSGERRVRHALAEARVCGRRRRAHPRPPVRSVPARPSRRSGRGHRVPVSRLPSSDQRSPRHPYARVDRQQRRVLELLREPRAPGPHHVQARSRRSILQVRRVVRCGPPAGGRPGAPVREGRAWARADPQGSGAARPRQPAARSTARTSRKRADRSGSDNEARRGSEPARLR